jgi:hypothetical protein
LFETLIAATNWPKFLKPAVARLRSVFGGRVFFARVSRFDLVDSFCATGFVGVQVVEVLEVLVVLEVLEVLEVLVVFEAVEVLAVPFLVAPSVVVFGPPFADEPVVVFA